MTKSVSRRNQNLKIHANRSGLIPGIVTAIISTGIILYDVQNWHVVHRLTGRYSGWVAFVLVVVLTIAIAKLTRRKAGYVQISSGNEER